MTYLYVVLLCLGLKATRSDVVTQVVKRSEKTSVLAALVISGHKATTAGFVQQSACAFQTMIFSARKVGKFDGDAVLMAGPLGPDSPFDVKSWAKPKANWERSHRKYVRELDALTDTTVLDLVPTLLQSKYPNMKYNLNYMKLAVFELPYDLAIFLDLDLVVVDSLLPIIAKATSSSNKELFGYKTCTAPVNSGFFIVKPNRDRYLLKQLDNIVQKNNCPCRNDKAPFADTGYDAKGSTRQALATLWQNVPGKTCSKFLDQTPSDKSWRFAGAGTGQGLMWYFFGISRDSYESLTYADIPVVHYNTPGPKPWTTTVKKVIINGTTQNNKRRGHCDFVWWRAVQDAAKGSPFFAKTCYLPSLKKTFELKRQEKIHFPMPACCRTCPGGGHFASPQTCDDDRGLNDYTKLHCKPVAQLLNDSNALFSS